MVFLHGLGGSAKDCIPFAKAWHEKMPGLRFVLPNAPHMPVTMNFGMVIPAWHDVFVLGTRELPTQGWPGLRHSVRRVRSIVFDELDTGADAVVLGGFSQGAVTALATAFHSEAKLAAVLALSGFYPNPDKENAKAELRLSANRETPVFVGHGTADPIVLDEAADCTHAALSEAGVPVTFRKYAGMQHTVSVAEIEDVSTFLQRYVCSSGDNKN